LFHGASSLTRGFALSLGCGEHCWLDYICGQKLDIQPINYVMSGREKHQKPPPLPRNKLKSVSSGKSYNVLKVMTPTY
ncbi:hypothetical protein MMU48_23540, partial [Escherichia coli]|uniref:hypothetical protein n=1 Tax=Escherichia coli TaxID=562 RepID=UPI001F0D3841